MINQPRLDRVAQRDAEHQVASATAGQVGGGERDAEVVGGVASLRRREEVVHEIDVADQHRVPERGVDRVRLTAADKRDPVTTAELIDLISTRVHWTSAQRRDAAGERVEDMHRQLLARLARQVTKRRARRIARKRLNLGLVISARAERLRCDRGLALSWSRCHDAPLVWSDVKVDKPPGGGAGR